MAQGAFVIPNLAKLNIASATDLFAQATYKLALVTSSWTPAPTTDEVWATLSANEIANGQGYTTGGGTLTSVTLTNSAGVIKFTSAAYVWTASGTGIPAWRYGVIRAVGTINGKIDPIVAYFLGDSTPADFPLTAAGGTLTFTPNASGIVSYT